MSGHIQCYYVHIANNVSFSLELVEEYLIRDYHSIELYLMETSHYITHCHVYFNFQFNIDWIAIHNNAHECDTYQNDARSMPYRVPYTNMEIWKENPEEDGRAFKGLFIEKGFR